MVAAITEERYMQHMQQKELIVFQTRTICEFIACTIPVSPNEDTGEVENSLLDEAKKVGLSPKQRRQYEESLGEVPEAVVSSKHRKGSVEEGESWIDNYACDEHRPDWVKECSSCGSGELITETFVIPKGNNVNNMSMFVQGMQGKDVML